MEKSEQLNEAQLQLLLQEQTAPGPAEGKASDPGAPETQPLRSERGARRKTKRAPRLPERLPAVKEVLVPEVVKSEPSEWRRIGEEVSEQLDYEPARFWHRRLMRPKYVHRSKVDALPVIAPLPGGLQERCMAAPGLRLAQILEAKYADFEGIMQADGYESYPCHVRSGVGEIRLAGCWAHARRGFGGKMMDFVMKSPHLDPVGFRKFLFCS